MFELKNFVVKRQGKVLVENVNFKFRTPQKYQISGLSKDQKDAFIAGLFGFPGYEAGGQIIWNSKWKLEDKETAIRVKNKFFLFSDEIPAFGFLKIHEYFAALGKKQIKDLLLNLGIQKSLLKKPLGETLTNEEKQQIQMVELNLLKPEFVFIDLQKPVKNFWQWLKVYPKSFALICFTISSGKTNSLKITTV